MRAMNDNLSEEQNLELHRLWDTLDGIEESGISSINDEKWYRVSIGRPKDDAVSLMNIAFVLAYIGTIAMEGGAELRVCRTPHGHHVYCRTLEDAKRLVLQLVSINHEIVESGVALATCDEIESSAFFMPSTPNLN
jgi:hypothetical protein